MKQLLLIFAGVFCVLQTRCQINGSGMIRGVIIEKETGLPIISASVSLVYAADSSLVRTMVSDGQGSFILNNVLRGAYRVKVSRIGYDTKNITVSILEDSVVTDLDTIFLINKVLMLSAIDVIERIPPVVMKKDTVEFNGDYFGSARNSVLENLLRNIPGFQIDKDGTIRYNGEKVTRLLIDGRELLNSDPVNITRYLSADVIDKIQIINDKSKWAKFSGIEDGQREKAINIMVKSKAYGQYIGRASGGYGTGSNFSMGVNLNKFESNEQISFLGSGSSMNGYYDDGVQGRIGTGSNGLIRHFNNGINYSRDLANKGNFGVNYSFQKSDITNKLSVNRINLLPDSSFYYNESVLTKSNAENHSFNLNFEYKPDSIYVINIGSSFTFLRDGNSKNSMYTSQGNDRQLLNWGDFLNSRKGVYFGGTTTGFVGRRFRKAGRSLSAVFTLGLNNSKEGLINRSGNSFVQRGGVVQDSIDQEGASKGYGSLVSLTFSFTEPIFSRLLLDISYSYTKNSALTKRSIYDFDSTTNAHDSLNDSLSVLFDNFNSQNQIGARFAFRNDFYNWSLGVNVQRGIIFNSELDGGTGGRYQSLNIFPSFIFNSLLGTKSELRFTYAGSTQQPTPGQLQAVPDNSNPLYIQLGNADLKSSFTSNFGVGYNHRNIASMSNCSIGLYAVLVSNKIIDASWFDSLGRQVKQPVNINGTHSLSINIGNSFRFKELGVNFSSNTSINYGRDFAFINGLKNALSNISFVNSLVLNYSRGDILALSASSNIRYSQMYYSIYRQNNAKLFSNDISAEFNVRVPAGLRLGGNANFCSNVGYSGGYNRSSTVLNAFVSKFIGKSKSLLIRLQGFDLLEQNIGIVQNVGANYIEYVESRGTSKTYLFSISYFPRNKTESIKSK
jgi:hypothetical protein